MPTDNSQVRNSLIIPVFNNEQGLPSLLEALGGISDSLEGQLEVVFVDDGSSDGSLAWLEQHLQGQPFRSKTVAHSRNFGAFAAIQTGLAHCDGDYCAAMAADLQEPTELILEMFTTLAQGETDVVIAHRDQRQDPPLSRFFSAIFWWIYRSFVIPDVPDGGVGTIACTRQFRQELLKLEEKGSSLIGLVFWIGFRRKYVSYHRGKRNSGKSGWSFSKKINYFFDSIFSFSDLPIKTLIALGTVGLLFSTVWGGSLFIAKLLGLISHVPGYTATVITILLFGCINIIGLGIVGAYVWRAFSNTQHRPTAIIKSSKTFSEKK